MTLIQFKNAKPYHSNGSTSSKTFNELVDELFGFSPKPRPHNQPSANIYEENTHYVIELAVPGLSREAINLKLDDGLISISANAEKKGEEDNFFKSMEFDYSQFERSFIIPDDVNTEKITAQYRDGMLLLNLPKYEDKIKKGPRQIDIK